MSCRTYKLTKTYELPSLGIELIIPGLTELIIVTFLTTDCLLNVEQNMTDAAIILTKLRLFTVSVCMYVCLFVL